MNEQTDAIGTNLGPTPCPGVWRAGALLALTAWLLAAATPAARAGLAAHWALDNGYGTSATESANGYNGTLLNSPIWNGSGILGASSLNFSTNSAGYVSMGLVPALDITGPITISAWWRNPGGPSGQYSGCVVSHGYAYYFGLGNQRSQLWFGFNSGGFRDFLGATATWTPDTWYHVAATMDASGNINLYVDGVLDASYTTTYTRPSQSAYTVELARNNRATGQLFKGDLDDVGIWNEALDAKKIALISGLGRFSGVDLGSASIDAVLAVYTAGSGSATAGGMTWSYKTGLGSTTVGATGGSVAAGNAYIVLDASGNGVGLTATPPCALVSVRPANNETNVLTSASLVAVFNGTIQAGTGNITLKRVSDNSTVETFDVTSSSRLTFGGNNVTIVPTSVLSAGVAYYVQIDATAIQSTWGSVFPGISDTTSWRFTTDGTAPVLASVAPAPGATGVDVGASLTLNFSETVQKGTGNIRIYKSGGTLVETIAATNTTVTINGATVTVQRSVLLDGLTGYYVTVDAGAFKDLSGNPIAGISGSTTWSFTAMFVGLMAHWALDSGSGTTATESVNGYNGILMNTPTWNGSGILGPSSLNFPTTSAGYVNMGLVPALDITNAITLSAWWRNPGGPSGQYSGCIVSHGFTYFFGLGNQRTQLWFGFNSGGYRDFLGINTTWLPDTWYHVAATMDYSGNVKLYVNGVMETNYTTTYLRPSQPTYAVEIARNTRATGQLFQGDLDDVGIWNQALDPKKIALINGLGRFSGVDLGSASIDAVLAVYNAHSGSAAAGGMSWYYQTGLGSTTVGATGGSVAGGNAYIVLDNAGNGVGITTPPAFVVTSLSPADNATNIVTSTSLAATFNQDIQAGTGLITLKRTSDNSTAESFDVASSSQVTFNGKTLTIVPSSVLAAGVGYYVQIAPTAVRNLAGYNFVGITDTTSWNFTTDGTPPTTTSFSPAPGAIGVPVSGNLTLTFSENVQLGTGNIGIYSADGTLVEPIDVWGGSVVVAGQTVTIQHFVVLNNLTGYYVNIDAGAFTDLSGNPFAGISGKTTWSFTTIGLGLVAHWALDEGAGTNATDSAYGFNGTLVNNPTWNGSGILGAHSLNFPTTNAAYVNMGPVPGLDITGPITVSAWWRNPAAPAGSYSGCVLSHGYTYFFGLGGGSLTPPMKQLWFGFNSGGWRDFLGATTNWAADTWYHVAATMDDGGNVNLYVNGVLDGSTFTPYLRPSQPTYAVEIARNNRTPSQVFQGDLDDLAMWNTALTEGKVGTLYNVLTVNSGALSDYDAGKMDLLFQAYDGDTSKTVTSAAGTLSWAKFTGGTGTAGQVTYNGGIYQAWFTAADGVQATNLNITVTGPAMLPGGSFRFTLTGPNGRGYQVLTSTNVALPLANWAVQGTGTFGPIPVVYTDTSATNANQFYRIKLQ